MSIVVIVMIIAMIMTMKVTDKKMNYSEREKRVR